MTRILRIVGAPTSAGAYAPGQELAPAAFRKHGLVRRLELAGLTVTEINPDHAPDEQETFGRLITMLAECLSRQSL